ncbi:CG17333 [Drosophila busckii]|uniref:6-phosphogluconolactonase n=1 Tax=Drosophila busckii TaxID=30019 RepID=A0A0M4EIK0_DROBS|nr:probable 6-phosphogluconolactonase [Drosophila busckii]ALC48741.1 CG17333 [Drosophila busckii]
MSKRKCAFKFTVALTDEQLLKTLADTIKSCAQQAKTNGNTFRIGLSGGSLVQLLTNALVSHKFDTSSWVFFFCDERYVAPDHNDSTYWAYKSHLMKKVPSIVDGQFLKVNTSLPLDACASDYESRVQSEFGCCKPEFDLLLLGMGPDGHTCSLFPEQPASLTETKRLVMPIRNSPKPPPERVTFTLPLINNAKNVVFVVTGDSKMEVVKSVFLDIDKRYPAAWVEPTKGKLTLITDIGAGQALTEEAE